MVVEVSVVMEEGEGSLTIGHVIAPSASACPVVSRRNCTVWENKTDKTPKKPKQTKSH